MIRRSHPLRTLLLQAHIASLGTGAFGDEGICGLPSSVDLPSTFGCAYCHDALDSTFTVKFTPTQTAGYSDEDLLNISSKAARPAGYTYILPLLRDAPDPDCVFTAFHTWELTDDEKKGIVWKLRSIPPKAHDEIDRARLRGR